MRKRFAALLRRWADRLDPPAPIVQASIAAPAVVSGGEVRHFVAVEGVPVYDGPMGARARDAFLSAKASNRAAVYEMDGVTRDWWPR